MKSKTKNWTKLTLSIDNDVTKAAKNLVTLERRSVSSLFETFVIEKYKETFGKNLKITPPSDDKPTSSKTKRK